MRMMGMVLGCKSPEETRQMMDDMMPSIPRRRNEWCHREPGSEADGGKPNGLGMPVLHARRGC